MEALDCAQSEISGPSIRTVAEIRRGTRKIMIFGLSYCALRCLHG